MRPRTAHTCEKLQGVFHAKILIQIKTPNAYFSLYKLLNFKLIL